MFHVYSFIIYFVFSLFLHGHAQSNTYARILTNTHTDTPTPAHTTPTLYCSCNTIASYFFAKRKVHFRGRILASVFDIVECLIMDHHIIHCIWAISDYLVLLWGSLIFIECTVNYSNKKHTILYDTSWGAEEIAINNVYFFISRPLITLIITWCYIERA